MHHMQVRNYVKSEKLGKETYLQITTLGISLVYGFDAIELEYYSSKPFQWREME